MNDVPVISMPVTSEALLVSYFLLLDPYVGVLE